MLDYATQVAELEKIDKLSPIPRVTREPPALGTVDRSARCLVCDKRPARPCTACSRVHYCGAAHQRIDARWHDAACATLATIVDGQHDHLTRPRTLASMAAAIAPHARVVHVMAAAQREADVPAELWAPFEVTLIGPELPGGRLYRRALWDELGKPDLIIGFHCGLMMYPTWKPTILDLKGSGVPFVITSYRDWEAAAEAKLLTAVGVQCLQPPMRNPHASSLPKRSATIANDYSLDNAYVSAWR